MLNRLSPMAAKMIAREGELCTYVFGATGTGTYDPTTGDFTEGVVNSVQVKAILMDFALLSMGLLSKNDSMLQHGDKQVYLSVKDINGNYLERSPNPSGDKLIDSKGNVWLVKLVKEYNPSGSTPIMYDLLVRR